MKINTEESGRNEEVGSENRDDNGSTCSAGYVEHKIVFGTLDWIISNTLGYATMIFPVLCCNVMGSGILDIYFFVVVFLVACTYILTYQACKKRLCTAWNFILIKHVSEEKAVEEQPDNFDPEAPFASPVITMRQIALEKEAYGFLDPPVCVNRIFNYDLFASIGLIGGCCIDFMFHLRNGTHLNYSIALHHTFLTIELIIGLLWLFISLRLSRFTENTDPKQKLKLAVQWFNLSLLLQIIFGIGLIVYIAVFAKAALHSKEHCCFIGAIVLWVAIFIMRVAAMHFIVICISAICAVAEEIEERSVWKTISSYKVCFGRYSN